MTLKQAFTIWSLSSKNTVLAANSREAVQKVLMKKYNDIDLEQITPVFARRIFSESTEIKEIRVKAASILVHVLKWGSENGYCQPPSFDFNIATEGDVEDEEPEPSISEIIKRQDALVKLVNQETDKIIMEKEKTRGRKPRTVNKKDQEEKVVKKSVDISAFSDDQLLDELDRRGWQGELHRTQIVTIGAKEG